MIQSFLWLSDLPVTAAFRSAQGRLRRLPGPILPLELPEELELLAKEITEYGLFFIMVSKLSELSRESKECLFPVWEKTLIVTYNNS